MYLLSQMPAQWPAGVDQTLPFCGRTSVSHSDIACNKILPVFFLEVLDPPHFCSILQNHIYLQAFSVLKLQWKYDMATSCKVN